MHSGSIPSGVSDAEALALFRKNQLNHPMTRVPYASQVRGRLAANKKLQDRLPALRLGHSPDLPSLQKCTL
jgi:hypothetical protein